ncbi:hypothetical protein ISF_03901 [Cordyceps fumosorosea ARSEF 2679]|uniref:Microbial-type PARG catalytic domain-containing protein n=1 Tax=Cordyceps fumosorosea (strain ARSEF 2679) TaxID=1081104 RepID=A0A167YAD2_CORFA|nr:hypothetical protein ISF_03901 [Cordyceps fumosorosea ARSEF 2679]OAA66063.1 hypothetical protein ISF_03901 [Cordyceps fumosorosea ARSEF 2679]
MVPGKSSRSSRPKPSDVALDTKRNFIPLLNANYAHIYPPFSVLYREPLLQLPVKRQPSIRPPSFHIEYGDPVERAIEYALLATQENERKGGPRIRIPFICAANERRPGGDWEIGSLLYEEKLCRRSNLFATLSTPLPQTREESNYPIPTMGGIFSDAVVVCRGPHDRYEKLDRWYDLPVLSMPPTRWPRLKDNGTSYSFDAERQQMKDKIRGALRICHYNGYDRVVVGDFGLGNGCRNPPQQLAEIWREVLLFDPELRGQFEDVFFIFEDPDLNTRRCIIEELIKKEQKSRTKSRSGGVDLRSLLRDAPPDMVTFQRVFDADEIQRVISEPDPRYGLQMITG